MELDVGIALFVALVAAVAGCRLVELRLSRRNQRALGQRGIAIAAEPVFRWMVALHTGVLAAAVVEVIALRRPFIAAVGVPALALCAAANLLRWWVIVTMGRHWNVRVMGSTALGVVSDGPFRWIRHPNYVAVFVELTALPLVHGAFLTAAIGAALHALILRRRIALEESILMADPGYRAVMGPRPRFVPFLSSRGEPWPARRTF
jgi:methyltransferase